jgi:hypothetical protein
VPTVGSMAGSNLHAGGTLCLDEIARCRACFRPSSCMSYRISGSNESVEEVS